MFEYALPLRLRTGARRVVGDVSITEVSYDHGAAGVPRPPSERTDFFSSTL